MPPDFDTAVRHFEAGRPAEAADTCRAILAASPGDLSANNMLGVVAASQGNFAEAAACFRACAKAAPNDPAVAKNFAQALLEAGDHPEALLQFKRVAELSRSSGDRLKILRNTDIDTGKVARHEKYVARLEDSVLESSYWGLHDGDKLYVRETANLNPRNSPWIKGRIDRDMSYAVVDLPAPGIEIDTPCIFLGGDENYAHWFFRYLMRLALIEGQSELAEMPLLTIESLKPYQSDTLQMLGYAEERLITVPRHSAVLCRALHVPVCLRTDIAGMKIGLRWLREKFLPQPLPDPPVVSKRLFVSRRDAPSRQMSNEDEVVEALSQYGFVSVQLSTLSVSEQIALFAQAELVVAPHGAGLANMAFAPATCALVELVSDPIANMNDFRMTGEALGQPVTVVRSTSHQIAPGTANPAAHHNFTVDPSAVTAAVENHIG